MSMSDMSYEIEQLYIEGLHPTKIAKELSIPLTMVYDWLKEQNVAEEPQEDYSPYETVNS